MSSNLFTETTNPNLKSFIQYPETSHFPIQNLPYGIFSLLNDQSKEKKVGVAIGEFILDLSVLEQHGFFSSVNFSSSVFDQSYLNFFMEHGYKKWKETRAIISGLLQETSSELQNDPELRKTAIVPQSSVRLHLPIKVGDYTDFYASKYHATNVGTMFRGPDNALQPNWLHLPVGYHGRASSVIESGVDIYRPKGQTKKDDESTPTFGPSNFMDYELEMGVVVGSGNDLGKSIPVSSADRHIFGLVLMNDWSARDIQKWEYVPLGPFLGKSFATSISPWVVPLDALAPFRVKGEKQIPEPLPYLRSSEKWSLDIHLQVHLKTKKLDEFTLITESNLQYLYWNILQQLAHHSVNGCNMQAGDLLGTGTISGPEPESYGCLLERTWRGTKPLTLPNGETRRALEDYDTVRMTGWCQGDGYRIGFGDVSTRLLPALP